MINYIKMSMMEVLSIAVGGALGALSRYYLNFLVSKLIGSTILGIFVVNVTGSFLLGLFVSITAADETGNQVEIKLVPEEGYGAFEHVAAGPSHPKER